MFRDPVNSFGLFRVLSLIASQECWDYKDLKALIILTPNPKTQITLHIERAAASLKQEDFSSAAGDWN